MASGGKALKTQTWTCGPKAPKYLFSAVKDIGKDEKKYRSYFNGRIQKELGYEFDVYKDPWCAVWIGVELEEDNFTSTKKQNARSYLDWGVPVSPGNEQEGDIVVFWRGSYNDGWSGHVGFILSADESGFTVLGGNQGDKVCIQRFGKTKLLGVRRYKSLWTTMTTTVGGSTVVTGASEIVRNTAPSTEVVEGTKTFLEQAMGLLPTFGQSIGVMIVAVGAYLLYKQYRNSKNV